MILGKATAALTLWAALASGLAFADPTPKIQFDKASFDLVRTSHLEYVTGTITIQNAGDGLLRIKANPTCDCIRASLKPDILGPGGRAELSFWLATGRNRIQIRKGIVVTSNDPQKPSVHLPVNVDHIPLYELTPTWPTFDYIRHGARTNAAVLVKRNDGGKLTLTKVEPSSPWITAMVDKAPSADEQSARVLLELKPEGATRRFSESVQVLTDDPQAPAFPISLDGRIVGDTAWTPEVLYWGIPDASRVNAQAPEAFVVRRLVVTSTAPTQSLELRNVTSTLRELKVELVTKEHGKSYEIVAWLLEAPAASVAGAITFETNVPSEPKISVPVTISVPTKK